MKDLLDSQIIVVYGGRGSGKTCFSYSLLMQSVKPKYFFAHPRPELLEPLGIKPVEDFADMVRLEDVTVYIDEVQAVLPNNTKNKDKLNILFSLARQRNLTLIFSTTDTRYFTIAQDAFIDAYVIKDINATLVKRGSPIIRAIRKYSPLDIEAFSLKPNEYLIYSHKLKHLNRKHTFKLPSFWSDRYSKPYSDKLFETEEIEVQQ